VKEVCQAKSIDCAGHHRSIDKRIDTDI